MSRPSRQPSLPDRLTAVVAIALVVLLNVLAASPELHAWVHGQAQPSEHAGQGHAPVGDANHECVVTTFAQGATALLFFCLLLLLLPLASGTVGRAGDWLVAARLRYWLVPSHAPPLV